MCQKWPQTQKRSRWSDRLKNAGGNVRLGISRKQMILFIFILEYLKSCPCLSSFNKHMFSELWKSGFYYYSVGFILSLKWMWSLPEELVPVRKIGIGKFLENWSIVFKEIKQMLLVFRLRKSIVETMDCMEDGGYRPMSIAQWGGWSSFCWVSCFCSWTS